LCLLEQHCTKSLERRDKDSEPGAVASGWAYKAADRSVAIASGSERAQQIGPVARTPGSDGHAIQ
jgi:hypothetical protein